MAHVHGVISENPRRSDGVRRHASEADRLDSLASYGILDSAPEPAYDALTALAALLCDTPFAAVTLVDDERQWFKSMHGLPTVETPRALSFCSDVVAACEPVSVPDATKHDRYRQNALVTGSPHIRSYLGVPLTGRDGLPLGALCVIDSEVHQFTPRHTSTLRALAEQVVALLEQRRRDGTDGLLSEEIVAEALHPGRLRRALEAGELVPFYQPLMDLRTGRPHQLEALLRWQHPTYGTLPPLSFLPAVESSALIVPVGRAVLEAALSQLAELTHAGVDLPGGMAVNVGSGQLARPGLARDVIKALENHHLPGSQLTVEITEATALPDLALAGRELGALTAMGVHVVIDDYGVGWSNLTRVLQLPVDALKIDRAIAASVLDDRRAATMVTSTVALARQLGLQVAAEGIENDDVCDHLAAAGCDWGQGWLFSPAVTGEQLIPLLDRLGSSAAAREIA